VLTKVVIGYICGSELVYAGSTFVDQQMARTRGKIPVQTMAKKQRTSRDDDDDDGKEEETESASARSAFLERA